MFIFLVHALTLWVLKYEQLYRVICFVTHVVYFIYLIDNVGGLIKAIVLKMSCLIHLPR
jgi:hypothetical protein